MTSAARRSAEGGFLENKKYPPYLFDVDFDSDAAALPPEPEDIEEEPAAPTFSEEELQAARDEAFEAGKAEAISQSSASLEQQISMIVAALQNDFASLSSMQQEANEATMRDAVQIATTIISKVLPAYVQEHGAAEIEAFVRATLSTLFAEADVIVRAPEATAADLAERLTPVADALGVAGKLKIAADPALGPADCRMEWGNGGAERNAAQIMSDIDAMVSRFIEHGDIPENADATAIADDTENGEFQAIASEDTDAEIAEAVQASPETSPAGVPTVDVSDEPLEPAEASPAPEPQMPAAEVAPLMEPESIPADLEAPEPMHAEPVQEVQQTIIPPVPEPAVMEPPAPEQASPVLPTLPGAIDTGASEQNT